LRARPLDHRVGGGDSPVGREGNIKAPHTLKPVF